MKQVVISSPPVLGECEGPIHLESDPGGRVFRAVCLSCGRIIDQELAERLHEMLEGSETSPAPIAERPLA